MASTTSAPPEPPARRAPPSARVRGILRRRDITSSLPALLVLAVIFALPLVWVAVISFREAYPANDAAVSVRGYRDVLSTPYLVESITSTLGLALLVTLVDVVLCYPIAYYLVRHPPSKVKTLVLMSLIAPLFTSIVVRTFGWILLLGKEGIINSALQSTGLRRQPLDLLYNTTGTAIGLCHIFAPFMVLGIAAGLNQVQSSLENAARVMGAGEVTVFRRITLPLSMPGVAAGCILVFTLTCGAYLTPAFLGGGNLNLIATDVYDLMIGGFPDWPVGAALSMLLLVAMLTIIVVFERITGRGSRHLERGQIGA